MKDLIQRLVYRSTKSEFGQSIVDESDLDAAIAGLQALVLYHDAYSDRRFSPEGSWEAGDAAARLEDAFEAAKSVISRGDAA